MDKEKFIELLKSVKTYEAEDSLLLETVKYINDFYSELVTEAKNEVDDVLNEFNTGSTSNGNETVITVHDRSLDFKADFDSNVVKVSYLSELSKRENIDQLVHKDGRVISEQHNKELDKDLLYSYLDIFKDIKNK